MCIYILFVKCMLGIVVGDRALNCRALLKVPLLKSCLLFGKHMAKAALKLLRWFSVFFGGAYLNKGLNKVDFRLSHLLGA